VNSTSFDLDGFLNHEFLDKLSSCSPVSIPPPAQLQVNIPVNLPQENSYAYDDDYNVFLEDDDYFPYANGFNLPIPPESPSVEDLRSKLGNMQKPSGHKQEKEEEEDSSSGSSSEEEEKESEVLHPVKKTRLGVQKNESFSSISSYSSGGSSASEEDAEDEEDEIEDDDEEDDFDDEEDDSMPKKKGFIPRKYKHPVTLKADELTIGTWSLQRLRSDDPDVTFDVKILFGRRKIKYEIHFPLRGAKSRNTWSIDFPFNFITALDFKSSEKKISFQLSDRPTFSRKEKGKSSRCADFTESCASTFQRHHLFVENSAEYSNFMEILLSCDRRLRQLSKLGISPIETKFPNEVSINGIPPCDWDKENKATKYCKECGSNYCDVCDDVIHRHEAQKSHARVPVSIVIPKPKKPSNKKRKKMNSDRCRCGTGATKGTLGEPCTGNRCPCFSNGKSCTSCGCKGCANPIKRNPRSPSHK